MLREKRSGGAGRGFGRRWGMGILRVETGEYGAWGEGGGEVGGGGAHKVAALTSKRSSAPYKDRVS